jgi:predicted NAD/FAD-dependent oxidoreductase
MNGLAKKAATRLQVHLDTEITEILPHGAAWTLRTKTEFVSGPFDWVLCTAPPLQSARLLPVTFSDHALLADARLQGCYTLMLGFDQAPDFGWDAAIVVDGPLAWIAASHSKPGRAKSSAFVCQSANDWADDNLERDQPEVRDTLLAAFCDLTGVSLQDADHVALHRWRYAKVAHPAERPFLFDPSKGLGAAGDWCGAGRVESAFDSATALGRAVMQQIS